MRPRYLIVAEGREPNPKLMNRIAERTGLQQAFAKPGLKAFVNADCCCLTHSDRGLIVGTLFRRHGVAEQIVSSESLNWEALARSDGNILLQSFWGGYVAAIVDSSGITITRDPSATFACYFARLRDLVAFGSDAELLIQAGVADGAIDWHGLSCDFFSGGIPDAATSLVAIQELLPGFRMRWPSACEQQSCWSPWNFVHGAAGEKPGAERLARTVRHSIAAWAKSRGPLLLSLSGGLDSSIVACSLAAAGAETFCLTMYDEGDAGGDERAYARALSAHLKLPLIERPYRLEAIDLREPLGPHLPRTKDRTHALAYERAHVEVALEIGADAFVTGNGGDSVFGYSQSAAPIVDRLMTEGLGAGSLEAAVDVCRQTGCSLMDAAASAWRLARRPRRYRCLPNTLFLSRATIDQCGDRPLRHPWLDAPAGAVPGKAAHIASILRVQQSMEPNRSRYLEVINPLMSQPIVETCLAVPSWEWRLGGIDRSLIRKAFASDLPSVIARRRVKGGPSHFAARVLDCFRTSIRDRLIEGHLASEGILDTAAVERALAGERQCVPEERVRLLEFVAAEAWIDSWLMGRPRTQLRP